MFQKYIEIILLLVLSTSYIGSLSASDKITDKSSDVASVKSKTDNQPLKKQATTTGFLQEMREIRVHTGPNRSGKEVYEFRCKGCHGKNTQGAPMPDDKFDWSMRLRKSGLDILLKHSMEGYSNSLMPPKGGCRDCNQQEVYAAVFYMLERSGINTEELRKKVK